MALSGSLSTNSGWVSEAGLTLYYVLDWTATQSIPNKTSTISWTLRSEGTFTYGVAERTLNVTIGGETVYSKTDRVMRGIGQIASGSTTLNHNADGTKSFNISINAAVYYTTVNCTASQTFTLNTIAGKSTLSVGNGTLGTEQTLTVTKQDESFQHIITAVCGGKYYATVCEKSSTKSIKFTPPLSWAQANTGGTSVSVKYTIVTYNGSSQVGSNEYTVSCTIPKNDSTIPTASISISDVNGYKSTYGAYIQGKSALKITVTASGKYGATIKSYKITADKKTYTSTPATTSVLSNTGTQTVQAVVTDTRDFPVTATSNITVLAYEAPKISSLSVKRCDANGNADSSGAYLAVTFSASITSLNSKNTASYSIQYKKTTENTYCEPISIEGGNYSPSNAIYIFEADTASSYDITVTATDNFSSISKYGKGPSISVLWSKLRKGLGYAIGKVAEMEGFFEVGFKSIFHKGILLPNMQGLYGERTDGVDLRMAHVSENDNIILGYGTYEKNAGTTQLFGKAVELTSRDSAFGGFYFNGHSFDALKRLVFCQTTENLSGSTGTVSEYPTQAQ